jgi:hypothetical protein
LEELGKGCLSNQDPEVDNACLRKGRAGLGCSVLAERAIAESHRRALTAAAQRDAEWTMVLEDDAVPVRPARWDAAFRAAWPKVPQHVKIVRLSWCTFPGDFPSDTPAADNWADAGEFHFVNWLGFEPNHRYNPGGCTSGYMVHRDIIPEILQLFPCCCALDCCLQHDFFEKPAPGDNIPRGLKLMLNMDAWGSTQYASDFTFFGLIQAGVFVQDARASPSVREEFIRAQMSTLVKVNAGCPDVCRSPTCVIGSNTNGGVPLSGDVCTHTCSKEYGSVRYCGVGASYEDGQHVDCSFCGQV